MAFKRNRAFQREIRATPEFQAGMVEETKVVESSIIFHAFPFRDSGNYIDRISTRWTRVYLESHFAHLMEYGSVNNPPQANARRGVLAAGLRWDGDREHTITP